MPKPKTMYTDRDYLEARFSSVDEKLDTLIEALTSQEKRIGDLEDDIGGAKLLGKAAIGIAAVFGGFVTWVVNVGDKLIPHLNR